MAYNGKPEGTCEGMSSNADKKAATGSLSAAPVRGVRAPGLENGKLRTIIGYVLRRAQLTVFEDVISTFSEVDLRPAQYAVLVLLGEQPGLKQSDVAAALDIQRANFVVLFDGLERRGLARRRAAPNDRRSYALFLTEAGEQVLARANELEAQLEARLDAKLGPGGRQELLRLLGRLAELH